MNTLMIEVGTFQSFDKSEKPQVMVIARDDFKEATLTFNSLSEACEKLPDEKALVDTILDQEEFHGLSVASDEGHYELEDCGLFVTGFSELHKANQS